MPRDSAPTSKTRPLQVFLATALGTIMGSLLVKLVGYLQHLWQQPRLMESAFTASPTADLHEQALFIASANLEAGIEHRLLPNGTYKQVLCAGLRNFREPWARDFGFASFGLLALKHYRVVRENLEVFLLFQHPSGQFPVKVHSTGVLDRYLHSLFKREQPVSAPLRPKYITAHNTISLDGNGLLIIAALRYARYADDLEFARAHWRALQRALRWLESRASPEDGLLHQGPFADWADTIARQGKILYTNVIYWKALVEMATTAHLLGFAGEQEALARKAQRVHAAINDHFWRPDLGYFVTSQVFDSLNSSGNLLAIAWGMTTTEQAHSILDAMRAFGLADPVPTKPVHRAYPKRFIAIENRLAGLANYHINAAWLWIGAWHVVALSRTGRLEEAGELLTRMARVIVRDGEVHEVYTPDGNPLSNLWYTSEAPLTWSAGMVVYAIHDYSVRI